MYAQATGLFTLPRRDFLLFTFQYNVDSPIRSILDRDSYNPHMQAFSESLIRNQSFTSTGNCPFIRVMRTAPGTRLTA
jgi:hypothetical protein